jgi:protein DEK
MKVKKRENPTRSSQRIAAVEALARMRKQNELQTLYEDSPDVHARRKNAHAPYKKSGIKEPKLIEDSTRKRKRDTERKPTSRKQSHPEPKSDCQEIAPIANLRNIIRKKSGDDPSSIVQPKISDDTLMYTKECNKELNGVKGGVQQQLSASDDWTEEQDLTLRQAYFTARPSPHFWKKVSKLVLQVLPFCFFGGLIMSS